MKVHVEYHTPRGRSVYSQCDAGEMAERAGSEWTCPRCGCMIFHIRERFGVVQIICRGCPTYMSLEP